MTKLHFFDGVGGIGGNKIVVESTNGSGLLLDFGYNFSMGDDYLITPFLNLREQRILLDGLITGLLPIPKGILQGIYRPDLHKFYSKEVEARFNLDLNIQPKITHVLISHAHSDHVGLIKYLHPSITPVADYITKAILEYYETIYDRTANFRGIVNYFPIFQTDEEGCRKYRDLETVDRHLTEILHKKPFPLDDFVIFFYPTDHSLVGAGAYLIFDKVSKKRVVYTGDFRMHGPLLSQVDEFIEKAKKFKPDALIIEGTRIDSTAADELMTEYTVEKKITSFLQSLHVENKNAMIFFECSRTDVFRFQSFYEAAKSVGRTLVLRAKNYRILQTALKLSIPGLDRINLEDVKVYLPRRGWRIYEQEDYHYERAMHQILHKDDPEDPSNSRFLDLDSTLLVKAEEISNHPDKYLTFLDLFMVQELIDINPNGANTYFIQSKSEWDDPESVIYDQKKKNWFGLFGIPDDHIFKAHCSGHISREHIKDVITRIAPKKVFPIHTLAPEKFLDLGLPESIEVVLPEKNKAYEL
ncbi:MAG: hypothetical protein ACTSWW_06410 [Promethearchaeota archaeon]